MESSFKTRVDRAFGFLLGSGVHQESEAISRNAADSLIDSGASSEIWSVSERAISTERAQRGVEDDAGSESDENAAGDYQTFVRLEKRGRRRRRDDRAEDGDLEEDSDDDIRQPKRRRGRELGEDGAIGSLPEDEDEDAEVREVKMMIGRDCTLDFEEEEDEYDKVAVGREGAGERMYMREFGGASLGLCPCSPAPVGSSRLGNFQRDSRANHAAAAARLKEDMQADAKNASRKESLLKLSGASTLITSLEGDVDNKVSIREGGAQEGLENRTPPEALPVSTGEEEKPSKKAKSSDVESSSGLVDQAGAKKSRRFGKVGEDFQEGCSQPAERLCVVKIEKKAKNVRFAVLEDPTEDERGVSVDKHTLPEPSTNRNRYSKVPDYVRNPSKYTHYTLEWSDDEDESKRNLAAFESFQALAQESKKLDVIGSVELPKSITFVPRSTGASLKPDGTGGEKRRRDSSSVAPLVSFAETVVDDLISQATEHSPRSSLSEAKTTRVFRKRGTVIPDDDTETENS